MGICTRRFFFLSICLLQMVTVVERQVFDFLGFLWIPILVNFFALIFIIFGFFGGYQYRPKYIVAYLLWSIFWLAWNAFIICLYLDVAGLDHKTSKVLKLDINSDSWWKIDGPGCKLKSTETEWPRQDAEGCLLPYEYVEIFQAGVQCFFAFFGCIFGTCLSRLYMEEDDTSPVSPKPMTPRRVKRRSVMTRGSTGRHSTSSRRQSQPRSSTRSSGRRMAQNPVTQLMEQQQKSYDSPSPIESLPNYYNGASASSSNLMAAPSWHPSNGHANPSYSTQSLNETEDLDDLYNNRPASVRSSYSNFHGARPISYNSPPKHFQHNHAQPQPQVPQKRNHPHRSSMRSMAFMNTGPPAYTSQGPSTADSETAI